VNVTETDEPALAEFYKARFRPDFVPASDARWVTDPSPARPVAPFVMDEYRLQTHADSAHSDAATMLAAQPSWPAEP
jgi:hypothetical protein